MGILAVVRYAHKTLGSSSGHKPFLYYIQECSVGDFYLVVGLGVSLRGEMIFYAEFCVEFLISGIIELLLIVSNNDPRNTELADDGLSGEVLDVSLDICYLTMSSIKEALRSLYLDACPRRKLTTHSERSMKKYVEITRGANLWPTKQSGSDTIGPLCRKMSPSSPKGVTSANGFLA